MAAKLLSAEEDDDIEEEELRPVRICRTTKGKTLDLSHQKLDVIPGSVLKLAHIQCFYLEDNLLKELTLPFAECLCQLTWLDLRHNLLHSLPPNISLLKCLKNLLLEGNQIQKLPVELGLLSKLTGLNLKGNPLEFPPRNIVEQGSKTILKYLREQYLDTNDVKQLNIQELNCEETNRSADCENGGPKNPVNFVEASVDVSYPSPVHDEHVEVSPVKDIDINSTLNIGKAKVVENRPSVPKQLVKSLSYPQFPSITKKENHTSARIDDKQSNAKLFPKKELVKEIVGKSNGIDCALSVPLKANTKKLKTKDHLNDGNRKILDIFRQTGSSIKKLDEKKVNGNIDLCDLGTEFSPWVLKSKVVVAPSVSSINNSTIQSVSQKCLKVGKIVSMNVSPEHHIPGQPCIGEVKSIPVDKDFVVVHFYTGTFSGPWVPMMSRQSPYLREVKKSDIFHSFQFDSENCLPRDVVALLKK